MYRTFEEHYQAETHRRRGKTWAYPKIAEYRPSETINYCIWGSQKIQYGLNSETYHSVYRDSAQCLERGGRLIPVEYTYPSQSTREIEVMLLRACGREA